MPEDREKLDEAVRNLGRTLWAHMEPPLERIVETLTRWLNRWGKK